MRGKSIAIVAMGVASLAVVVLHSGCVGTGQSPPSRFYLLSSIDSANDSFENPSSFDDAGIGLGPLRFPAYLKRPQIVTRISPNEIRLAEFDRWAEPLENNFTNVLKENLSILLNTAVILEPPWPKNANLEYQVVAGISRFDAKPGKQVVLLVRWAVIRVRDEQILKVEKSTYTAPLGSRGYDEIVRVQSQIVAEFSRDIAAAVQQLHLREHGQ